MTTGHVPDGADRAGTARRAPATDRRDLLRIGAGLALGAVLSRAFAACAQEQEALRSERAELPAAPTAAPVAGDD